MSLKEILQNPQFPVIQHQIHWLSCAVEEFDPKTGEALPLKLSDFLWHILEIPQEKVCRDRIWKIASHAAPSLHRLFRSLTEAPRRVHASMPIYKVRELDVNSFVKISLRPGRNIREKLSSTLNIEAVDRVQSVDLTENRLLKEFVIQFSDVLDLLKKARKSSGMSDKIKELYSEMQNWLRSDDAQRIGKWTNLPPNNALLSHREYQCIWDAWGWLQTLERDLDNDMKFIKQRQKMIDYWTAVANCKLGQEVHFAEMPITIDYDSFVVKPWSANGVQLRVNNQPFVITEDNFKSQKVGFSKKRQKNNLPPVDKPVCVDLTAISPAYTVEGGMNQLSDKFIWQEWSGNSNVIDLKLFDADAVWLHKDAVTVTSQDVFFSRNHKSEHLRMAADAFTSQLRTYFKNDALIWLVPDYLNDFDLETLRSSINVKFSNAQPLPRSVAAVFENLDKLPSGKKELNVLVLDSVGGVPCATRLTGTFSNALFKKVPETKGYIWRRHPSITLESDCSYQELTYFVDVVDENGNWIRENPDVLDSKSLSINDFSEFIQDDNVYQIDISNEKPVIGGFNLYRYQNQVPDTSLWCDNLPELSIKIIQNGLYDRFYLVKDAVINPKHGVEIDIPIKRTFTLPANNAYYEFQLYQGEGNFGLQYSIYLQSPMFPCSKDISCKLKMSYTYGADMPYKLSFNPDKNTVTNKEHAEVAPIEAKWIPKSANAAIVDYSKLPVPEYPLWKTWSDFTDFPAKNQSYNINLFDKVIYMLDELDRWKDKTANRINKECDSERQVGIVQYCNTDSNQKFYCKAEVNGNSVFCHSSKFIERVDFGSIQPGVSLYMNIGKNNRGYFGYNITVSAKNSKELVFKKLFDKVYNARYAASIIWNSHSLQDYDAPDSFRQAVMNGLNTILVVMNSDWITTAINDELLCFLCCLHKDTPYCIANWLTSIVDNDDLKGRYFRDIGLALGSLELPWQKAILDKLISKSKNLYLTDKRLGALSIALWRSSTLINSLSFSELQCMSLQIVSCLNYHVGEIKRNAKYCGEKRILNILRLVELMLALLRSRRSANSDIQKLLAPDSDISKKLVDLLDELAVILYKGNVSVRSRINFQIKKPKAFSNTPDLLYALRLYLTGDSGANTIVVESVDDDD